MERKGKTPSATVKTNLTEKRIAALPMPVGAPQRMYDAAIPALGLKLLSNGRRVFFWSRNVPDAAKGFVGEGRLAYITLGEWPGVTLDAARVQAQKFNTKLADWRANGCQGRDPFPTRRARARDAHHIRATAARTFRQQAEQWLDGLATRKREPLQDTTIYNRRKGLQKQVYPVIGEMPLAEVNSRVLKELVEKLSAAKLAASTIKEIVGNVKSVVASAMDESGEVPLYPRAWNDDLIDVPEIGTQRQPSTTAEGMTKILERATDQYRVLYALLAGCGPLRVGEALGLEIDKHIADDFRTLYIRQKAKRGEIQPYLKTKSGEREVDLCPAAAKLLRDFVDKRKTGLLFQTAAGGPLSETNTLRRKFHPILRALKLEKGGFNIFRRFRITHLQKTEVPEALRHFWSGHAPKHVSERYTKLHEERAFRLEWAEKIGLGFQVPPPKGKLRVVPRRVADGHVRRTA